MISRGEVVGAQALTRFLGDTGDQPDGFAGDRDAPLGSDFEFAAMESALTAARILPAHLFAALKLSPATCLDPLLPGFLEEPDLPPGRLVLEVTETMTREQPAALAAALAPLRRSGIRLAIDHAGSYVTSIRQLRASLPVEEEGPGRCNHCCVHLIVDVEDWRFLPHDEMRRP